MGFRGIFTLVSVFHGIKNQAPVNLLEIGRDMNNISKMDFP